MLRYLVYFCIILLPVLFSCRKDVGQVNYGNYPNDIGKIISNNCSVTGCHNSKSYLAASGYNLESWLGMFSGSYNGSPVVPYSTKFSSLCYYINTYPELGIQNTPTMPLNKPRLSYDDVKKITDWISQGAPDVNGNVMWADNAQRKKAYAVNQGCDVVTVFDTQTQLPMRFIDVGTKPGAPDTPHQVRVSPDGKFWYVIFVNSNIMQKFSCADDSYLGIIPLTPLAAGTGTADAYDWNTFTITKDGKRAYVVSWTANGKVSAVDLENMKLLHYMGGLSTPHAIALSADETSIFVGAQTGNYITQIDSAFSTANEFSLDNSVPPSPLSTLDPHDMILSPNNVDLFITCQKSNEVRVFNTLSMSVTAVINTGNYPQEIVYSKSTNQYFVSCTYDSTTFGSGSMGIITRINASGYGTSSLRCGYQPHGIGIDENRKMMYVLSRNIQSNGPAPHHTSQCAGRNGFVNFIDLGSFSVSQKKYELSVDPYYISIRP